MLVSVLVGAVVAYAYFLWDTYSYWRRKGVVGPVPLPLFGNYLTILLWLESESDFLQRMYFRYPNEKCIGLYRGIKPVLLLRDQEMIYLILVKKFDSFFYKLPFVGASTFSRTMSGSTEPGQWKSLRTAFSPILTKAKISKTIPLLNYPLVKYLEYTNELAEQNCEHDVTGLCQRFSLEAIGCITLGREMGCFSKDSHVMKGSKKYMQRFLIQKEIYKLAIVYPMILKLMMPVIHRFIRTMYDFYIRIIKSVLQNKENDLKDNSLLDFMLELKGRKYAHINDSITIDVEAISQQIIVTWFINYVNVAHTLAMAMHHLAKNQDIQNKAREEIDTVLNKYGGKITMDAITDMKYLDMIIDETLRRYTPNGYLNRYTKTKFIFPNSGITIDRRVLIVISNQATQNDPEYFPDPEQFDPERFSSSRRAAIPKCAYLSFGAGPRNCIGMRLTKMVLVLGLAPLLQRFQMLPSKSKDLKPWPYTLGDNIPGGVWLNIRKRN